MKKLLLTLLALAILPFVGQAQEVDPGQVSMVFTGSVAGLNNLGDWNGGFSVGTQFPFPGLQTKSIHTRLVYSQFNIGPDAPMRSIEPCAIIDFYVGKSWRVWWKAIGLEAYTDGPNKGMELYTGFGLGRRIWTVGEEDKLGVDLFMETSFVSADDNGTGNYADLSVVLLLTKL